MESILYGYAKGIVSIMKEYDNEQLADMWHGYSQNVDINIYTDFDTDTIHATAYFLDADGNQLDNQSIQLF